MSEFLYLTPCSNCGSSDANAVYSDGHSYCFSCKHIEGGVRSIQSMRTEWKKQYSQMVLPEDFDYDIHQEGREWLGKYSLSNKEIVENRFGWSEKGVLLRKRNIQIAPLLVFPIYDQVGHLLMWQARNFGAVGPKYLTKGAKDVLHILGEGDHVVLTEDLLSAIKVSRITSAMPLWGSFLSLEDARRLSKRFSKLSLWLDKDKTQEAFKQARNYSHLFKEGCSTIRSERDPKEYSTEEIKKYLTN